MPAITGPRYPTASRSYGDIMLYEVALSDLPRVAHSGDSAHRLVVDFTLFGRPLTYKLYPQCVEEGGQTRVAYYLAFHAQRGHNEFAIGPARLDQFAGFVERFAVAAANFYGFTHSVTKQEVDLIKIQNQMFAGNIGRALRLLGRSWLDALQDPNWVIQTVLAHGALVGGGKKLPGPKGPAIVTAVEEAQTAGRFARSSGTSGTVAVGEYGGTDALRAAINVSAMDEVTYSVQSISGVSQPGVPSVAKVAHRELLRQAAETAKASGKKTFILVGEQANPNFVRHADGLANRVGVPGSGKQLGGGAGHANYRVELVAEKVLAADQVEVLADMPGRVALAEATAANGKKPK
jgi:hypothetical protein